MRWLCLLLFCPVMAMADTCGPGTAADQQEGWRWIANNAVRTADAYAVDHNPAASFVGASVDILPQQNGPYAGGHIVRLMNTWGRNTSVAFLAPRFDMCAGIGALDDTARLFDVIYALHNRQLFGPGRRW